MSGYGGNLTYPTTKLFYNSGGTADLALVNDQKAQKGYTAGPGADAHTLVFAGTGDYIPSTGKGTVSYSKVVWGPAVAKVTNVVLNNRAPADTTNHELGFTVKKIAQHPLLL